ncbi:uncharacterized protein L201_000920 [Kwoniella dendrophila CBS 6074]|uniref:HTH psq-type domain-containing protein n=1 Tax=Kwoniella dendrophila CBS 6074 TaxID=1295534 RepID=A0AAX4JMQ7_9TREE
MKRHSSPMNSDEYQSGPSTPITRLEYQNESNVDIKPDLNQGISKPTPKKARKSNTGIPKTPKKAIKQDIGSPSPIKNEHGKSPSNSNNNNRPWTPDKKERFLEKIFGLGIKACNVDEICQEFDLTKLQFKNATQSGRKGNIRDKACKAIRGD